MSDVTDENAYVDKLIDEESLQSFLTREFGERDRYEIERLEAGHSNETVFVTWGDREFVVRRPPAGDHASGAHDVLREYRILDALQDSNVPVPPVVLGCDDHDVIGSDFFLMDRIDGDVIRETEPSRFESPEKREQVGMEVIDVLAAIHNVDFESLELPDFGRPDGFTERQIDIWTRQLDWAFEVTSDEREIPELDRIETWLRDNLPESTRDSLVHGDYKLDNLMFDPDPSPEVIAVFDWEMSTFGDPLTDLGYLMIYWREDKDPDPAVPELEHRLMEQDGYPSRQELVSRYEEKTGIEFEHQRFYRTLALYKMAGYCEMFLRRYLEGNSDDPLYAVMDERVPEIADRAIRIIEGEEPL